MAFDQNVSVTPKDLRPLNIVRALPDDPRIAPVTSSGRPNEGLYGNPPREFMAPGSMPAVYYPAPVADAGLVGVGYSNAAGPGLVGWVPHVAHPLPTGVVGGEANSRTGSSSTMKSGVQIGNIASDQVSEEAGDDSVSGRKVKFLCSFGGRILPRPSDGALRYAGGQTRIISVRRDISYNELVQKMADIHGPDVVIKYQLPDEDLDALVSVSCADDLENMMDEYEKLVERSTDSSVKLRVFLFSASELDSSSVIQYADLQDTGLRYVEAVNGLTDGGALGGIMRKGSTASASSTQNSDVSGYEAVDSLSRGQGEGNGILADVLPPSGNPISSQEASLIMMPIGSSYPLCAADRVPSHEAAARTSCADSGPPFSADNYAAPLSIPVVKPGPAPALSTQADSDLEKTVPFGVQQPLPLVTPKLEQPMMTLPGLSPYLPTYVDPKKETHKTAEYISFPSQMGFPPQILGGIGPVYMQQPQFPNNAVTQQFIPAVQMTMTPGPSVSLNPSTLSQVIQPQQIQAEQYPLEGIMGQRPVQLPSEQAYTAYHTQVPVMMTGGAYGWHQMSHPEQLSVSGGCMPHHMVTGPDMVPRFEDCHMCQKSLPHAHSDTVARDRHLSPGSTISDPKSIYHSLCLDERGRLIHRAVTTGALAEGVLEEKGSGPGLISCFDHELRKCLGDRTGMLKNVHHPEEKNMISLHKTENSENQNLPIPNDMIDINGGIKSQSPSGVFGDSDTLSGNAIDCLGLQNQQRKQEGIISKAMKHKNPTLLGIPEHMTEYVVHESPKEHLTTVTTVTPADNNMQRFTMNENQQQINGKMQNLQIHPGIVQNKGEEHKTTVPNFQREDALERKMHQVYGPEALRDYTYSRPVIPVDANQAKPQERLSCSSDEAPYLKTFQPSDFNEAAYIPGLNPFPKTAVNYLVPTTNAGLDSADAGKGNPVTGVGIEEGPPYHPNAVISIGDAVLTDENATSLSPSIRPGDEQEGSSSHFDQLDTWTGSCFPPPMPCRLQIKKDSTGTTDHSSVYHLGNGGELPTINSGGFITVTETEDGIWKPSGNLDTDLHLEHLHPREGSSEELIKQELKAVAEGVAASVLQPSVPSHLDSSANGRSEDPSSSQQKTEFQNSEVERTHKEQVKDTSSRLAETANLGFRVLDGLGTLQIIKNSDLEEIRELGSGTFGTVYHGKWRGTDVAIKRINDRCFAGKPPEQERMRDDFWNEAKKLADLHHPNVVAFYGVVLDGPGGSVATVTEYMVNGSLRNALQKSERNLDKRKRLLIAMDTAFGMEYLHGKNIVHFDLKSDNLLVNLRDPHRPICKVGDLGLSKVKCQTLISGGVRGTLPWMAPELLNGSSSLVSEKVDVFSFGIVLWELLTGEEPYADLHYGQIIGGIVSNTLRPSIPESCDTDWRSLMERCWSSEPLDRPSFTEIANELRSMSSKLPAKGQNQQSVPSQLTQVKS